MKNFSCVLALLCSFSWICVSVCEFHTMLVQPGEEVTLQCSNRSSFPAHLYWFKLTSEPNISCISSMFTSESNVFLCEGRQHDKFNMTSNTTNVFLHIKRVHSSDSGLYFCGVKIQVTPGAFTATYLQVKSKETIAESTNLLNVILGGVVLFLVMIIIGLVIRIRSFHIGQTDTQTVQNNETDALNYAALSFRGKAKSSRRHVADREPQTNVLYAATR